MRSNNQDPTDTLLERLQLTQNKFARFMHGSTLMDRITTVNIFKETGLLSINKINAQIKLTKAEIVETTLVVSRFHFLRVVSGISELRVIILPGTQIFSLASWFSRQP